jgi:AraC-like DNA-binding protein
MFLDSSSLASLVSAVAQAIESYGCDSKVLLRRAGLDPEKLHVPGWRYPMPEVKRLWELALEATGDPCLGLRAAQQVQPAHLHALGLAWMASTSLHDAMLRLVRYHDVISKWADVTFQVEAERSTLRLRMPEGAERPSPLAVDGLFAMVVSLCRLLTDEDFVPLGVSLRREDPGRTETYQAAFHCPVVFEADGNAVAFRREDMEAPLPAGNPELASEVDGIADRYLRSFVAKPTAARVRRILVDLLPSSRVSQEQIARQLGTSVSSLQRQLRAEGMRYRDLFDETRKELALRYIEDGRYALAEIAFLLGFADQSTMTRAFRRWTGSSPGRYRETETGVGPA